MPPLGLGSGSGLGNQSSKGNKSSTSTSRVAKTKTSCADSRDWGVNSRDETGRTALHFASRMIPPDCAHLLLDAGADIHAYDKNGYTPLHMAASYGRCNCVKLLLEHGANVFAREREGRTPRELAVNIRDNCNQSLEAVKPDRGDIDLTIRLLTDAESKHSDTSVHEKGRKSPKTSYSSAPLLDDVRESRSIVPNKIGKTKSLCSVALGNALTVACRGGHVDVVKLVLSSGAHVDTHDPDGATPLLAAADGGFANCVQLLLKHGADADAKDRVGVTALIAAAYNGHSECLEVLLKYNASVDARSHGGVTALIAAAEGCNADCTQILLQAGAQVNAKTSEGKTALLHAVSHNCVEATEVLLTGGAEVNAADGDGCTALHHGARNNSVDCLRTLLERGADVTRKCRRGRMPIQEAPKGSQAAKLLEDKWKKLESEIAMRQMEVLNLFQVDRNDQKSNTSKRSSTRHSREKKSGKRKDPLEKIDRVNLENSDREAIIKAENKCTLVDELSSPVIPEIAVNQAPSSLLSEVEDPGSDKTVCFSSGIIPGNISPEACNVCSSLICNTSCNSETFTPFSAAENDFEDRDEWIKVNGRRTAPVGSPPRTNASQSEPQGVTSTVSLMRSIGHVLNERKISGGQSTEDIQGASKILKEDDSRDAESSPWLKILSRRTHSVEDRNTRPCLDAFLRPDSLPERKADDNVGENAVENQGGAEEKLSNRVQRFELELEQARQAVRANMHKVKDLEKLLSTRQLGSSESNSVQVSDLTRSLEIQIRARVQAEKSNMDTELRIRDLEAVVSSQRKILESVQTEVAELKLQMLRREEQHKQECELHLKESIAAAMAAAAGSCRAWELHHSRESLRGWISECAETSRSESALLLLRSGSGYKIDGHPLSPAFLKGQKKSGSEKSREDSIKWKSTVTAAAMAASSVIGAKSCSECSALETHPSHLPRNVSETLTQSVPAECTCNEHECDANEVHEAPADQEASKVGKGMVRSASEGSLQFSEGGADQRAQDLLPFIPMAGLKTDPVTGWFSLVPSPVD